MISQSKPKDAAPLAGTTRGGRFSPGHAKPIRSASTPESKLKSTTSQSQTPVKVPHYLRASTGSCHDFCKYGGRRALEEELEKCGSHSSKKKSIPIKGPKWKDILSYDIITKTPKPQAVPLVSMKVTVPTKPKLERPSELARRNLHRQPSLDASCSGTKGLNKPLKVSSAPAKTKVGKPETVRRESVGISNRPKIQVRSEQKLKRRPSAIVQDCADIDMGPSSTINGNDEEVRMDRTPSVVDPELEFESVQVDFDSYKEKTIEVLKSDIKESTELDFGIVGLKGTQTDEVSKYEDTGIENGPQECLLNESDKNIQEISTPLTPDKETVVETEPQLGEKHKNSEPDKVTFVESEPELVEKSKKSEQNNEGIVKSESISSEFVEDFEPESESDFESSAESEESLEFESESECEGRSVSMSRSASSGSVGSAPKNEKLKIERRSRRSGCDQLEEKKAYKLKFKPARVMDLKPDNESEPRRLKFRKPRMVGDSPKSSGNGRKASYRKQSRTDLARSDSMDQKSAAVVLRHQDGKERKEGQNGLFNNVIEETASKLVESRKSKVKALVGAFETVISLQDGKPTSSA